MKSGPQMTLFTDAEQQISDAREMPTASETQALAWERDAAKRALDELFTCTHRYLDSASYHCMMKFVARFRSYSPYNAMLIHVQMPGATFVAPPGRWLRRL